MDELVWLNLWNTPVGNAGMEHVAKLKKLKYLNLDNTAVDDDGLKPVAALPELTTLSLNQTGVTDDGLENLSRLQIADQARTAAHRREQKRRRQIEGRPAKTGRVVRRITVVTPEFAAASSLATSVGGMPSDQSPHDLLAHFDRPKTLALHEASWVDSETPHTRSPSVESLTSNRCDEPFRPPGAE